MSEAPPSASPPAVGLGDRATDTSPAARKRILVELTALWLGTLLFIRAVLWVQGALGLPQWTAALVPLAFIYAPVLLCQYREVDSWAYRLSIPAFRDVGAWARALGMAVAVAVALGVPFVAVYHLYQVTLLPQVLGWLDMAAPRFAPGAGGVPDAIATLIAYQLFFVAIPEEFFYRGYFQTRLNEAWPRKWLVFGVPMGWGAVMATAFFAFGHSLVLFQWWHFATFFPGLVFAWMRERTGAVVPGAFFHAICNVGMVFLDTWYGIR